MPKSKNNPHQSSFFQREIPQMPEGYYSSGPNPNLRKFVEEHTTPYDPETDNYDVPPFDHPITTTKTTAIYNMHTYWSKKPHDAIREYIKHYTKQGDLVLDPLCGSGGTSLAALMEGRAAIAIDLSPAATFITKNYCTPVDVNELLQAFKQLRALVNSELSWLYKTRCDQCGEDATIHSTVYSALYRCGKCLTIFPLMKAHSEKEGYNKVTYYCPACSRNGVKEEISLRTKKFGSVPLVFTYRCDSPKCSGQLHSREIPYPRNDHEFEDLLHLEEIEIHPIIGSVPEIPMMYVSEGRWGLLQRPYHGDIRKVSDFYTPRNLRALAYIITTIHETFSGVLRDVLLFSVEAISMNMSKLQGYSDNPRFPNNMMKGTLYTPPVWREYNVVDWLEGKIRNLIAGYKVIDDEIPNAPQLLISTQSATSLDQLASHSVDYIFTDPPYSYKIQFAELNFMWEAWLGLETDWKHGEIIVNDIRGQDESDWSNKMQMVLSECFRVLKPERWISICYHDSSEGSWQILQDLLAEVGFIAGDGDTTVYIDTDRKSWKQLVSDKVTKRDLVINFRKPRPGEVAETVVLTGDEDISTFAEKARLILSEALEAHPGSAADRLYDELVSRMIRRGEFERHNFDELLRSVAEEVNGRWYLFDTVGLVDEVESKKETATAQRLEGYMQRYLAENRNAEGAHYSDLFEQYLPIKDKPRRLLQDWLPEFFYKTPDGTWRPPADEEERQQKAALRSSGALRRIKRFANALIDGVPPADRDKPENAVTLVDWIRQCRRTGLYELGRVLYEKGGRRFEELNEEMRLLVEEDYQICVGRSEKQVTKRKAKGQQPSMIEEYGG